MSDLTWMDNPQATVVCPSDVLFGLTRESTADGNRRNMLRPGPVSHGDDGLPAPGVLFLLADAVVGGPCVRVVAPTEVIVTSSLHLELYSRPFDGHHTVAGVGGLATRYHGGTISASTMMSGDVPVAAVSGRFVALPNDTRAAGAIGDLEPNPVPFDFTQFSGPVLDTLGARVIDGDATRLTMSFLARPEVANERLGLHGGVAALMGERACYRMLQAAAAPGYELRVATMNAAYFRPIPADGGELRCVATVQHAGRQLVAVQATLYTQAGKPAVVVDVTAGGVARD